MLSKKAQIVLGIILALTCIAVLTVALGFLVKKLITSDCEHAAIPLNLHIRRTNDNRDLEISWSEPWPNYECDVTYLLTYWINNDRFRNSVTGGSLTIHYLSLEPCSVVTVELRAISEVGNLNDNYITNTYTEFPRDAAVTDIQFTTTDKGLSVTWARPVGIDACGINYQAYAIGELDMFSTLLDTEQFDVPYNLYCFKVYVVIFTLFRGQISSIQDDSYEEKGIIENVNFAISAENPQELIISWNKHYKHELCMMDYNVVYSSVGMDDQSIDVIEPEATFNFEYCADANVAIQTHGLQRKITGPTYTFDATQWPSTEIAAIQDINFGDISNNMLLVSWLPPAYHSYCDIIYTVSAENPAIGENDTCTGTIECGIRLSDFCPDTEIEVRASWLNDEVVNGKPAMDTYDCPNLHNI